MAEIRLSTAEVANVPRYIVERSFPEGFELPFGQAGVEVCRGVVGVNDDLGVTWVHSYVRDDRHATWCVYDAPNPESIRRAAERNGLPIERITRITVLDPYFYTPPQADAD
jgi:Nickel responsive protein SCO4226-like